jgi:hypothetical protein
MINGPELWRDILREMPPGAIIAGGAVRDYLLDIKPKDIDVFMKPAGWIENRPSGFHRIDDNNERDCEYRAMSGIHSVSQGDKFGFSLDVIEMDSFDPARTVGAFDFALTRCWFDGMSIHDTVEAQLDRWFETATLLIDTRPARAEARFNRFNLRAGGRFTLRTRHERTSPKHSG